MRIVPHENTVFNISHIADASPDKKKVRALLDDFLTSSSQGMESDSIKKIKSDLESAFGEAGSNPLGPRHQQDPAASPSGHSPGVDSSTGALTTTSWVLLGAGAAGLVAGGILQGAAGFAQSNAEKAEAYDQFSREKEKMENLQTGALVGFVAGGVIAGTGLVFYFIAKGNEENSELEIAILPSARGLILQGRF
jgi:hypothetical protein